MATANPRRRTCVAVKAYVLIVTDPGATKSVFEALQDVEGVIELHEVMGPYDIVCEIEVPSLSDVPAVLSGHIRTVQGIQNTTSLVTFPEP
jgi:DNA-binding Lrp family transcriptional regulator